MKIQVGKEPSETIDAEYVFIQPEGLVEVDNASCTHLKLGNTLDLYRSKNRDDILKVALGKIRYGGKITLDGLDISVIGRNMYNGRYTNSEINNILFSNLSMSDIKEMTDILLASGFEIERSRFDDSSYYIEASRPKPHGL
jgi:hypothetical protein